MLAFPKQGHVLVCFRTDFWHQYPHMLVCNSKLGRELHLSALPWQFCYTAAEIQHTGIFNNVCHADINENYEHKTTETWKPPCWTNRLEQSSMQEKPQK